MKPILLIEDSAGDILLIKQVLSQANFATTLRVAVDGEEALQVLADPAFKPALIILDLNIPKVPGLQLLERSHPAAPVVVFTSSANPKEIQRAIELGVREFVQKPYEFIEFTRVVLKMIKDWSDPGASGTAGRSS